MDFSISPFFEGIRLVTPSEAWNDNSVILVIDRKFLKRFTLPADNPEGRREGEVEFASKYIHQTGGLINKLPTFKTALKNRKKTILS